MASATEVVVVDRPIEDVFSFLADGSNNPRWRDGVLSITKEGGDGSGAVWRQRLKGPGGRKIDGDYKITTFEPPSTLSFQVIAGPARPVGNFVLRSLAANRTEVKFTLNLKPSGAMRLMAPMINRQVRREVAAISNLGRALDERGY